VTEVTLLDCTLRDGGYYTGWDFEPAFVDAYLSAMDASGIGSLEMGYRYLPRDKFLGAFAYCDDTYLQSLQLPADMDIGVMVNAAELTAYSEGPVAAVNRLFTKANNSPVDFVRVAIHFTDISSGELICRRLTELGYRVTLNLMQAGNQTPEALNEAAGVVAAWNYVSVLYLADSFGGMDDGKVRRAIEALKQSWDGELGMHSHDNTSRAVTNSLAAIDAGATWIDGSVRGIGRGAGNARTEYLILELLQRGHGPYEPSAIFALSLEKLAKLEQLYHWGPNLLYYVSALYNIHPTYVQEMLSHERYHAHHLLSALNYLSDAPAASFDPNRLQDAMHQHGKGCDGTWDATGWADGADILLLGAGPGTTQYRDALATYIRRKKPLVISLNVTGAIEPELVTAFAACNATRILLEADKYRSLGKPLIIPLGSVPEDVHRKFDGSEIHDYGMRVEAGRFEAGKNGCVIPFAMVVAYVLALACASGASRLLLAGFDGYMAGDPRQAMMEQTLQGYAMLPGAPPLLALTPTSYSIPCSSIFSPDI